MPKPIPDTWERGSPYDRYIGRWSRRVAPAFLSWLDLPSGAAWLDVGCGTGALSVAIADRCAPACICCVEPSTGFLRAAAQNLRDDRATFCAGSAESLPLRDSFADAVVSGLVLNFVPDTVAALQEMRRVAAADGVVAAYVWDYADRMEPLRIFWDTASALDASAAALHEGTRFPLCNPAALQSAFRAAAFGHVEATAIDVVADFADFDDYWQPFLGGQGPAPTYVASLAEPQRAELREALRGKLSAGGGGYTLAARAWAVRGDKA